jgi:hypothetical protein
MALLDLDAGVEQRAGQAAFLAIFFRLGKKMDLWRNYVRQRFAFSV